MPKEQLTVALTVSHTNYSKEAEKQAKRKATYAFEREYGKGLRPVITLKYVKGCSYTYQFDCTIDKKES